MRTTVTLDDEKLAAAKEMSGVSENATVIRDALDHYLHSLASRYMAQLGGSCLEATLTPRHRNLESGQ